MKGTLGAKPFTPASCLRYSTISSTFFLTRSRRCSFSFATARFTASSESNGPEKKLFKATFWVFLSTAPTAIVVIGVVIGIVIGFASLTSSFPAASVKPNSYNLSCIQLFK